MEIDREPCQLNCCLQTLVISHMATPIDKLKKSLASIASLIEKKKPKTLREAKGMLAIIEVIASETLVDIKTDELGRPIDDLGRLIADE